MRLTVRRRKLTFASSRWPCSGCHTCWGGADGKASIERLCLSPYVEKPFNSKVIKSFVPELRSRKCFSCFGIPMFYVNMLRTFYVQFTYSYHGYGTLTHTHTHIYIYIYTYIYIRGKGSMYVQHALHFSRIDTFVLCKINYG